MNKFIYQKDYPVVQTKEGALRGYEWKGTCIFKGIPEALRMRIRNSFKNAGSLPFISPQCPLFCLHDWIVFLINKFVHVRSLLFRIFLTIPSRCRKQ